MFFLLIIWILFDFYIICFPFNFCWSFSNLAFCNFSLFLKHTFRCLYSCNFFISVLIWSRSTKWKWEMLSWHFIQLKQLFMVLDLVNFNNLGAIKTIYVNNFAYCWAHAFHCQLLKYILKCNNPPTPDQIWLKHFKKQKLKTTCKQIYILFDICISWHNIKIHNKMINYVCQNI